MIRPIRADGMRHWTLVALPLLLTVSLWADPPANSSAKPVTTLSSATEPSAVALDDLPELPGKVTNGNFYGTHGKSGYPVPAIQVVRVRGVPQAHAISQAANSSGTVHVEFDIKAEFKTFRGKAGLLKATEDDGLAHAQQAPNWNPRTASSPVKFQVIGDKKLLWTSRPIQAFDDWEDFEIDVAGVKTLRLAIVCDGAANFCWSCWANPQLIRTSKQTPAPTTPATKQNKPLEPAKPVPIVEETANIVFTEPLSQICWGGAGKYLIGHFPNASQLVVYDIVNGKEVKRIALDGQDARFAANQTDLIVAIAGKNLQRFDLQTLERLALVPLAHPVAIARMGCASHGPLLLWSEGAVELRDPSTLQPLRLSGDRLGGSSTHGFDVRVSADGRTFIGWTTGLSSQTFTSMEYEKNRILLKQSTEAYSEFGRHAVPNADGSLILVSMNQLFTSSFQPIVSNLDTESVWVPSLDPRYLIAVRRLGDGKKSSRVTIHTAADRVPIYSMDDFEPLAGSSMTGRWGFLGSEVRVMFAPELERLASIPWTNDRLVIRRLNIVEAARQGERLVVLSKPPQRLTVGDKLEYTLQAVSPLPGALQFKLLSSPDGMVVSTDGKISWSPTQRPLGGKTDVVVSVRDGSSNEVLHQFQLEVVPRPLVASNSSSIKSPLAPPPSTSQPNSPPTDAPPPGSPKPSPADLTHTENFLELTSDRGLPVVSLQREGAWLIQDNELWSIAADGITLKERRPLPKTYADIRERKDYFVVVDARAKSIDLLNKRTLQVDRSTTLACMELTDIGLHPSKPLAYVAMRVDIKVPGYRFVVLNERTGKATASSEYVGRWVRLTPDGRRLISGYRDIYQSGSELILNPDRFDVVPKYGNLDWLIRYDLDGNGLPTVRQVNAEAGGNGKGLRMSADGERVTYLSHVGTNFSGNLTGFSTRDLKETGVVYATNGIATTYELAYHPTLPLVASPGPGGAAFFHRENGTQENDRIKSIPAEVATGKIQRIFFSPNGKNLIFDVKIDNVRYLAKATLSLTDTERQSSARSAEPAPATVADKPIRNRVPLRELQALAGGQGKQMSAADIAREFSNSVVIVASEDGSSGSGFAIGSSGYVLTCAHCLSESGQIWVHYRNGTSNAEPTSKALAEVVNRDDDHDLALLKIANRLNSVRIGVGHPVVSGERVNVIGNPGLGSLILDQTITEGIVSNPNRLIEGIPFIQTSAAVNPGSSGSPLFNDHGLVIGMVVLKARIDGAGFAVNASDIGRFLVESAKIEGEDGRLEREWFDLSGTRRLLATFHGIDNSKVKLTEGERQRDVDIARLSKPDQEFLKLLSGKK